MFLRNKENVFIGPYQMKGLTQLVHINYHYWSKGKK